MKALLSFALAAIAACSSPAVSGVDAAADSSSFTDARGLEAGEICRDGYPPTGNCYKQDGVHCVGDRCVSICEGVAGGRLCNTAGSNDGRGYCCGPGTQCCDIGFEQQRCLDDPSPCPFVCTNSSTCPQGKLCGVSCSWCGSCTPWDLGLECLDTCPAGQGCGGNYCCGPGTRCASGEYYCEPFCEDGGVADASDAGGG
ncbi:MAG TPA: hypothetical protein VGQ83_17995 [Polyangia bacterium]|jgi:hypothetical protein